MSKTFRDRFHVDLVLCEDCGIGIPEFPPGQPGDPALFHQAVIRFDIKTAVMALPIFMAADVAQIQEPWIRSFAFFVALSFQEDLIQDKISQFHCPFAVFGLQRELTAQYRPAPLRLSPVQVLSKLAFHKKFPAKEINIAVPETGDLGDPQACSDRKEHGQIDRRFLLLTQIQKVGGLFHGINLPGIRLFLQAWPFYFGRDPGIDIPGKIVVLPGIAEGSRDDARRSPQYLRMGDPG